ncbi:hypothetical protein SAY86_029742 [Trapa natans]|uniref:Uncharacterized protein n=1 Tax=Trapa natans TaxID=22666 RepID=A0AAN7RGE5_TRANT|nr:hypothetical protein SAY86_029742 [Trapa natans]
MDGNASPCFTSSLMSADHDEDQTGLKRGPWTVEEDLTLIDYITHHGEGRWNSLARCAGLRRTGKSCRLRWLNYLRPDVRRGNITLEEQLLILELHSRWGNRWSKIAQYLPGRTDNEIKNYWRTRVQKHAKQLKCDVNSKQFKDTMRHVWMPRLLERIQATTSANACTSAAATPGGSMGDATLATSAATAAATTATGAAFCYHQHHFNNSLMGSEFTTSASYTPENSSTAATTSSDSFAAQVISPVSGLADQYNLPVFENPNPVYDFGMDSGVGLESSWTDPRDYFSYDTGFPSMEETSNQLLDWLDGGETSDSFWNVENIWSLQQQQQFNTNV